MLRRFLEMCTNINSPRSYQGNNNYFTDNKKQGWINVHSLFSNQIINIKSMVIAKFNIITRGLYWSTGKKIEPQARPKVIWEKAIKTWIEDSLSFSVSLILILSQQTNLKINGQIDDVRIYNYGLTAAQVKTVMNEGAIRFGPVTGSP